jgi:outer membrane protein assembly factor BamA
MNSTIQRLAPAYRFGHGRPWHCRHSAWAVDPFTVRDIRVEGLQRVEPGTIFASLPVRVGDTYNDEKGAAAIRRCLRWACSRTCAWKSAATCWW